MIAMFFLAMLVGCVALVLFVSKDSTSRTIGARLAAMRVRADKDSDNPLALTRKGKPPLSDRIGDRFKSYNFGEGLEQLLIHSASTMSVERVLLVGFAFSIAAGITLRLLLDSWLAALLGIVAGAFVPYVWLLFQRSRRVAKFNEALADAIDLMARALRAGHSMASSIEVIAEQSAEPLAGEFAICFQQQKFGIPYRDALLAMGERVPSEDLQFLITAVLVQKETGGDLTDILDRTTAVIRDRLRIQGEVSTRTAQGRLTGWILSALPIVMLFVINIITPGYTHVLFTDPIGQKLLIGGGVLILTGGFIISKIVDIKV